jgi:ubiquinone/menaquinone biosynthesis C-methylase UbiE/glycosyltransferase involved in cell wall biosynthesis
MNASPHSLPPRVSPARVFGPASDEFWFWCLSEGREHYAWLNELLPGLPSEDLQRKYTGRSGAAAWEQAYGFYQVCKQELTKRRMELKPGSRVLDFGCGWGRITRFFLKDIDPEDLIGVDVIDEAVQLCRETRLPCDVRKVQPLPPLPFPEASFDCIVSFSVFSHLSEKYARAWMEELRRVLKPGGVLLATTRPREAVAISGQLRAQGDTAPFILPAARSFRDPEAVLRAYDAGEFCFDAAGEALGLSGWFGETLIPEAYARKVYADLFGEIGMVGSRAHGRFDQNLLILRAPLTPAAAASPAPAPAAAAELPWSGERLVPSLRGPIVAEHLHRYALATELVGGKTVLDVACGEGYGSRLLAQRAQKVYGVDISAETVAHAEAKYGGGNLNFLVGAAERIPLPDRSVDAVVSFETIEHVASPEGFLTEILRCLKPDGLLIISSPDQGPYGALNAGPNPFHLHEMTHADFLAKLRERFRYVLAARQRFLAASYLAPDVNGPQVRLGTFTGDFDQVSFHEGMPGGIYSVAVCSDRPVERVPVGIFETPLIEAAPAAAAAPPPREAAAAAEQALQIRAAGLLSELWAMSRAAEAEASRRAAGLAAEAEQARQQASRREAGLAAEAEQARRLAERLEAERAELQKREYSLQAELQTLARHTGVLETRSQALTEQRDAARHEAESQSVIRADRDKKLAVQVEYAQTLQAQLARARDQAEVLTQRLDLQRRRARTAVQLADSPRRILPILRRTLLRHLRRFLGALERRRSGSGRAKSLTLDVLLFAGRRLLGWGYARPGHLRLVIDSGLFDPVFYRLHYPEVSGPGENQVRDYLRRGVFAGRDPNAFFNTQYYLQHNPEAEDSGVHPFVHFLLQGAAEERDPGPDFDTQYYLANNPDVARAGVVPFVHFFLTGRGEGRMPKGLTGGPARPAGPAVPAGPAGQAPAEVPVRRRAPQPLPTPPAADERIKVIAFYLPQFHPIPENDAWWGPGFTEWEHVVKGQPLFEGHQQPHLPAELGFYDLRLPEVRDRQAEMARAYGIHAFCYYYYWFNGRRLLDRPLQEVLASGKPDLPFCLCWANENWTRNWDGEDQEILLEQKHSLASDLAFIEEVLPILQDPRYVRFGGKPVLLVYRADRLKNPRATARAWRERAVRAGLPGLHLCAVETVGFGDPASRGFDAVVEFPPNSYATENVAWRLSGVHPEFRGRICEYGDLVARSLDHRPAYAYHRAVMGMWDNTPRRHYHATIFRQASPEAYERWLNHHVTQARRAGQEEALIFINAWNEWGEGAHLEPDQTHGRAYLEATARALAAPARPAEPAVPAADPVAPAPAATLPVPVAAKDPAPAPVVLVVHDAHCHGAQYIALAIARALQARGGPAHILLRQGGDLQEEFARAGRVFLLPELAQHYGSEKAALTHVLQELSDAGVRQAICNTVVTGAIAAQLKRSGFRVLTLVHELPTLIDTYGFRELAEQTAAASDRLVFPARFVQEAFQRAFPAPATPVTIRPQGVLTPNPYLERKDWARQMVRERHGLPPGSRWVLNCGYGDLRKGPDLFLAAAREVLAAPGTEDVHFLWVGNFERELRSWCQHDIARSGLAGRVHLVGFQTDVALYMAGAEVFALTSREDPFPNVTLSALEAGVPVAAFADAGGAPELLRDGCGVVVPYLDVSALAEALVRLLNDPAQRERLGRRAAEKMRRDFALDDYVRDLLDLLDPAGRTSDGAPAGKG